MRRTDRRRARLDRLARRGDRDLAGAVLLFERGPRRFAECCDLRAAVHAADATTTELRRTTTTTRRGAAPSRGAGCRCAASNAPSPPARPGANGPTPTARRTRANASAETKNNAHTIVACVAIASRPSPPTTASSVRNTSRRRLAARCPGVRARARARCAQRTVRTTEDIESVIEITDRVVCPLRTGSQHGRQQHDRPKCSENDQDHECQDLSTTFVVGNGNNG